MTNTTLRYFQWSPKIRSSAEKTLRKLTHIHPERSFVFGNAGDLLNEFVLSRLYPDRILFKVDGEATHKLFSIGSVANFIRSGDVLAGIGAWHPSAELPKPSDNLIVGLRGPRSLERFRLAGYDVSTVRFLMDPGVLAARLFMNETTLVKGSSGKILYLPHYLQRAERPPKNFPMTFFDIDCTADAFMGAIFTAKAVVTSSLHGMILAHSFGVPVVLFRASSDEPELKYWDYADSVAHSLKVFDRVEDIFPSDIPSSPFEIAEADWNSFRLTAEELSHLRN